MRRMRTKQNSQHLQDNSTVLHRASRHEHKNLQVFPLLHSNYTKQDCKNNTNERLNPSDITELILS